MIGDKSADALAGYHQPVGFERRDRLAHDRSAHPRGGDHFLLGRQPRTGRQLAADNIGGEPGDKFAAQAARCLQRTQQGKIFWPTLVQRLDTTPSIRSSYD